MTRTAIDRDKVRAAIRRLGDEYIFLMLSDAIELLPEAKLRKVVGKYLDLKPLCSAGGRTGKLSVLKEVEQFEKASLKGDYYESFSVNSKNYMEKSTGTKAWMADFGRLLNRCVVSAKDQDPAEVRKAMDILFGLLGRLDDGHDDVIFFGDEGGSWQVGVDWKRVLPAWFKVLAATAQAEDYARRVRSLISKHYSYGRDQMLAIARRIATAEQRRALRELEGS